MRLHRPLINSSLTRVAAKRVIRPFSRGYIFTIFATIFQHSMVWNYSFYGIPRVMNASKSTSKKFIHEPRCHWTRNSRIFQWLYSPPFFNIRWYGIIHSMAFRGAWMRLNRRVKSSSMSRAAIERVTRALFASFFFICQFFAVSPFLHYISFLFSFVERVHRLMRNPAGFKFNRAE